MKKDPSSTLFLLREDEQKSGPCGVCGQAAEALRFFDASSGVIFSDCCINWVVKLSSIGIRPPSPSECLEFEKARR